MPRRSEIAAGPVRQRRAASTLRKRLRHEALENAARDVKMAAEWFPLEEAVATGRAATGETTGRSGCGQ